MQVCLIFQMMIIYIDLLE